MKSMEVLELQSITGTKLQMQPGQNSPIDAIDGNSSPKCKEIQGNDGFYA